MLSQAAIDRMDAALGALRADATGSLDATPGAISTWFGNLIGADTTVSAANELARHAELDYERFVNRYGEIRANPYASDADADSFCRDAAASLGGGAAGVIHGAIDNLNPVGALKETAAGTLADLEAGAKKLATIGGVSIVAIGGIALGVFLLARSSK